MDEHAFQVPGLRERLKALREKSGLTQEQVAERMGITCKSARSVVSAFEHAPTPNPTLRVMSAYLRAVGARWADLNDLLDWLEPLPSVSPGLIAGAKKVLPIEPPRPYRPSDGGEWNRECTQLRANPQSAKSRPGGAEAEPGSALAGESVSGARQDPMALQSHEGACGTSESDATPTQGVRPVIHEAVPAPPSFVQPTGPLPPRKGYPKMTPELFKQLFPDRNRPQEALEKAKKAAAKFRNGIAAPSAGAPLPPVKQNRAAEAYQDWQFQSNIIRRKVLQLLADSQINVIFNNNYVNFGLKVLTALRRAGKVKDPTEQEAVWSRNMDAAYAYAEKHVPDLDFADKVREVVIHAYDELMKR